LRMAPIK